MKTIILSFALLLITNFMNAAILRCSKDATGPNIYATAQAAHDAATAGDIIHLEPAQFGDYGSLNVTKQIILISTGDFISQNPNTQAFSAVGFCSDVNLNQGSENSVISAKVTNGININVGNIAVQHSRAQIINVYNGNLGLPISNVLISKCHLGFIYLQSAYGAGGPFISNIIIANNFIFYSISSTEGTSSTIENNTIRLQSGTYGNNYFNSSINRNIFYTANYYYPNFNNCSVGNNICDANPFSPLGTNQINVDFSILFQNWNNFNGDNYQLLSSYPDQNLGMYGGSDPYTPACQPAVPAIYQLSIPVTSNGSMLPIQVSTKSNN